MCNRNSARYVTNSQTLTPGVEQRVHVADCVAQCLHYIALDSSLAPLRLKDASPGGKADPFLFKTQTLQIAGN